MNIAAAIGVANLVNEKDEDENRRLRIYNMRKNNIIRNISNPFNCLTDKKFQKKFRLPKEIVEWLIEQVSPDIPDEGDGTSMPKETQILCALRFYVTGSFQATLGDVGFVSTSQSTVCRIIHNVSTAIIAALEDDWINFPTEEAELHQFSCVKIMSNTEGNN